MCMLCVVPPGVMPDRDKLVNSALNNPHGYGFSIVIPEEKRILRERTMSADESINRFLEMRGYYMDGYAMWHARYATHGSRTVANCHPFILGDDDRTHIAHNGILPVTPHDKDDRSDTRIFAEDILPTIGGVAALDNDYTWEMLEEYTAGSKVAVLTVDPRAQHECYVLNQDLGKQDTSGVWWSNDSCYLDYGYADPRKGKGISSWVSKNDMDFFDDKTETYQCPSCDQFMDEATLDSNDSTCFYCAFCFDCSSDYTACMCRYSSVGKDKYVAATGVTKGWSNPTWDNVSWDY